MSPSTQALSGIPISRVCVVCRKNLHRTVHANMNTSPLKHMIKLYQRADKEPLSYWAQHSILWYVNEKVQLGLQEVKMWVCEWVGGCSGGWGGGGVEESSCWTEMPQAACVSVLRWSYLTLCQAAALVEM